MAAWGWALRGSFQYDDFDNVLHDGATQHPSAIAWRLLHGVRPLLRASYALDYAVWGSDAFGFLLTNLALHLLCVLGVLALARRLEPDPGAWFAPVTAALLVALQPSAGEVVAYVSGRSTGLMTALLVWGLAAHAGAGPFMRSSAAARTALSLTFFAAACLAKEVALVFPLLVAVWNRAVPPPTGAARPRVFWAMAAAMLAVCAVSSHYRGLLAYSLAMRDPWDSLVVNLRALPEQLSLLVRPDLLSIIQPFDPGSHDAAALLLGGGIALVLLATALRPGACSPWAMRLAAFAAGWLLAALLPTQSLIAKTEVVTAKPLYLAWIGPALAGGVALGRLASGRYAHWSRLATICAIALAGAASVREALTWSDNLALWSRAASRAPADAVAWNNLGDALLTAGRHLEALDALQRARRLEPNDPQLREHVRLARLACGTPCAAGYPIEARSRR